MRQSFLAKITLLLFVGFLSFFLVRTVLRNMEWGRPFDFYKNLLKHSPNSVNGHLNMATVYMSGNNLKLARQEFQIAFKLRPKHPLCYYGFGFLDYIEKNKTSAVENWKVALGLAPFYGPARRSMNQFLFLEDKKFRKLLKDVKANPKDIKTNYRLSELYLEKNLYIEALDKLGRVLEMDPENFDALFNRAGIYYSLGLYRKAASEYKALIELSPDDPSLYNKLEECYKRLNK